MSHDPIKNDRFRGGSGVRAWMVGARFWALISAHALTSSTNDAHPQRIETEKAVTKMEMDFIFECGMSWKNRKFREEGSCREQAPMFSCGLLDRLELDGQDAVDVVFIKAPVRCPPGGRLSRPDHGILVRNNGGDVVPDIAFRRRQIGGLRNA